ncbi:MAG: hypothetical protein P8170_21315 [Gemmatimonadota bacterium]
MDDPKVLVRLHVETLFTLDSAGDLVGVTGPGVSDAPRFFLGSTPGGRQSWVRADLEPDLRRDLATLVSAVPGVKPPGPDPRLVVPFRERLEQEEPVRRTWVGPAYRFPDDLIRSDDTVRITAENAALLEPYLEDWVEGVREGNPVVAQEPLRRGWRDPLLRSGSRSAGTRPPAGRPVPGAARDGGARAANLGGSGVPLPGRSDSERRHGPDHD